MVKLYTRSGDKGETFLLFGEKVSKNDIRVECYGVIDECMSNLGVAKSILKNQNITEVEKIILNIQRKLFIKKKVRILLLLFFHRVEINVC